MFFLNCTFLCFLCLIAFMVVNSFERPMQTTREKYSHPYADFIAQWNNRSGYDHFCFFSPMNCPFNKGHPFKAVVKQSEIPDFLRALNAYRRWLEEQKKQQIENMKKKPRGTRRKLMVEYERKMRLKNDGKQ